MSQEQPDLSPNASDPPSDSPFASEPEEPQLSIQHLMIWAVCVAVSCSAYGSLIRATDVTLDAFETMLLATRGMMHGTGLAGLVLFITRRVRQRVFPRYAGEMLWLMIGIQAVVELARHLAAFLVRPSWLPTTLMVFGLANLVVWAGFYLYAILHCKERRWKMVFVLVAATHVAALILTALTIWFFGAAATHNLRMGIRFVQPLLATLAVAAVAAIDIRQPQRYPWTHWVGILLLPWRLLDAGLVATIAWIR